MFSFLKRDILRRGKSVIWHVYYRGRQSLSTFKYQVSVSSFANVISSDLKCSIRGKVECGCSGWKWRHFTTNCITRCCSFISDPTHDLFSYQRYQMRDTGCLRARCNRNILIVLFHECIIIIVSRCLQPYIVSYTFLKPLHHNFAYYRYQIVNLWPLELKSEKYGKPSSF